jgi:hypothetical protein
VEEEAVKALDSIPELAKYDEAGAGVEGVEVGATVDEESALADRRRLIACNSP